MKRQDKLKNMIKQERIAEDTKNKTTVILLLFLRLYPEKKPRNSGICGEFGSFKCNIYNASIPANIPVLMTSRSKVTPTSTNQIQMSVFLSLSQS